MLRFCWVNTSLTGVWVIVEYVSGIRVLDLQTHGWIEGGGVIVDVTSDQFDDVAEEVAVTKDHSWHSQFAEDLPRHAARTDVYDSEV
jgi:hypothetical protein